MVDLDGWTWRRDRNQHRTSEMKPHVRSRFPLDWQRLHPIPRSQEPLLPRKRRTSRERADRGALKSQRRSGWELFSRPNLDARGARAQSAPHLMSNQGPSI
jgi:hypothetical protein